VFTFFPVALYEYRQKLRDFHLEVPTVCLKMQSYRVKWEDSKGERVIKNLEGIRLGLFEGVVPAFTWRDRKRHSRYWEKKSRFEPVTN
jgi:hypothetical protein